MHDLPLLLAAGAHPGWAAPFVVLLVAIAALPLIPAAAGWWHRNTSKLLVSCVLAAISLTYYLFWHGFHGHDPGASAALALLQHAVLEEYVPFVVLLFSLYTIAGGIELRGDLRAVPATNTAFLSVGAVAASLIGTTGAAMLLIRPLLRTNAQRRHVAHTVVFFIFTVCNCGGLLLPLGDPPLFLGYLRGVPFEWTLTLFPQWAFANGAILAVYWLLDRRAFRKEAPRDVVRDATEATRLSLAGGLNLVLLPGVVLCAAVLDPNRPIPGTSVLPPPFAREALMLGLAAASYFVRAITPAGLRARAGFGFGAIAEVACLFIGIFITMQTPLELLREPSTVAAMAIERPMAFFWATGALSAVLDNAPTYVVFFEMARNVAGAPPPTVAPGISEPLLAAISCGAVLLGAMTYIGNGPNFIVKAIAEQSGVAMPSFLGYLRYSLLVLLPIFVVLSLLSFG